MRRKPVPKMTARNRIIVHLFHETDITTEEIADAFGRAPKTIRNIVCAARREYRENQDRLPIPKRIAE